MIRAALFDLDGTLFDRDTTVAGILAHQLSAFSRVIRPERARAFRARVTTLDDHGHGDKRTVYATVAHEFGLSSEVAEQLLASFWSQYPLHCGLNEGVLQTLSVLREHGKRLGIVTNGAATVQNAAIDALGIRRMVDTILVSETEGVRKPDAEIFRRAAGRLGVSVSECCFVGDHPVVDVEGAAAAGLMAVWKRTPYWDAPVGVPIIARMPELLDLVLDS